MPVLKRAEADVAFILPHPPHAEQQRIARASLDHAGRTLIENYSTKAQAMNDSIRADPEQ